MGIRAEVWREQRAKGLHVAIVDIGQDCRRWLRERLHDIPGFLKRPVGLVHVDEGQL